MMMWFVRAAALSAALALAGCSSAPKHQVEAGTVDVTTDPVDAEVSYEDPVTREFKVAGSSPLKAQIRYLKSLDKDTPGDQRYVGKAHLVVKKPNYKTWEGFVDVGTTINLKLEKN